MVWTSVVGVTDQTISSFLKHSFIIIFVGVILRNKGDSLMKLW